MQTALTILIVAAAVTYLAYLAYRFFNPKPNAKACGGNCCDNTPQPTPKSASATPRVQMISSDDLRNRLQARRA